MSELDGLEEIDLTARDATRSTKRMLNGRKQFQKLAGRTTKNWKTVLHRYQARKAKKAK